MSQTLTTSSPIIKSLFTALESSASGGTQINPPIAWSSLTSEILNDINASLALVSELTGMQVNGTQVWWTYQQQSASSGTRFYYISNSNRISYDLAIAPAVLNGAFPILGGNQIYNLLTTIAYEAGHTEDPQFYDSYITRYFGPNGGGSPGSDLQFGAEVALQLLGEGKSLYNDELVASQITGLLPYVPYDPTHTSVIAKGNDTNAILYGAQVAGLGSFSGYSTTLLPTLLEGYWGNYVTDYLTGPDSIETEFSQKFYDDISSISISLANSLTFTQNTAGIVGMTIGFSGGSISSYIADFGGYGAIEPDSPLSAPPVGQNLSPSSSTETTYQEFTFTDGHEDWFIDSAAGGQITIVGESGTSLATYHLTLETGDILSFKYAELQINGVDQGSFALPTQNGDGILVAYTDANAVISVAASNEASRVLSGC